MLSIRNNIVRTWVMRGTIHLLNSEDIRWLVSLLGPVFLPMNRSRMAELGLREEDLIKALREIPTILGKSGPASREELMDKLVGKGISINKRSQAPAHIVQFAALKGIISLGPYLNNGKPTYVLMERWVDSANRLSEEAGLTLLAERYLKGYGPADLKDFVSWSGLPVRLAKKAWELMLDRNNMLEIREENRNLWLLESGLEILNEYQIFDTVVKLLPAFDSYLLGYRNREYIVSPEHQKEVFHGGQTVPVVLVNGLAAGVWRYERRGKNLRLAVRGFASFDNKVLSLISEEAEDIGRFFGMKTSLEVQ